MKASESRILLETLRLTRHHRLTWTHEIATSARVDKSVAERLLAQTLGKELPGEVRLSLQERVRIATIAAGSNDLAQTARTLDWREFEVFAEECLQRAGFDTERNVRLNDGTKRWEIDIVAKKISMMLCIDCKHWAHSSPQRLRNALEHQRKAATSLNLVRERRLDYTPSWTLPIVLTLFDNQLMSERDVGLFVSVVRFQDFLEHLSHYDSSLPFIPPNVRQKPIS